MISFSLKQSSHKIDLIMVASKQNDVLTLLNLACLKHTGCLLPVSDFTSNNWKYRLVGDSLLKKIAVWSPHPYFNPIHLYYPSDDFGARVLRSLVVGEIDFIKNGLKRLQEKLEKESNPYGYKDGKGRPPMMPPHLYFIQSSKPSKISRLFLWDDSNLAAEYPKRAEYGNGNEHHPSVVRLDRDIMKRKWNRPHFDNAIFSRFDVLTQKGTLRKKVEVAQGIYETRMMAIGMSNCSPTIDFPCSHNPMSDLTLGYWIRTTRIGKIKLSELVNRLYIIPEDKLEPEDFIRIYNPKAIDKKKLIHQKLIANFTQSD